MQINLLYTGEHMLEIITIRWGNFDQWGNFPLIFFLILMFIGGCAGSTTCGIKVFRVHILYYFIRNQLLKIIYPRAIINLKYNNNREEPLLGT